ncbi:MAG: hypothetical protein D6816_18855, partial [Bacteroidetes bacterium]
MIDYPDFAELINLSKISQKPKQLTALEVLSAVKTLKNLIKYPHHEKTLPDATHPDFYGLLGFGATHPKSCFAARQHTCG